MLVRHLPFELFAADAGCRDVLRAPHDVTGSVQLERGWSLLGRLRHMVLPAGTTADWCGI